MTKQVHYAWVCVGHNKDVQEPTWFYAFRTPEKAMEFTKQAAAHSNPEISTVKWVSYPCEFMEVDATITSMEQSVRESVQVWD
jgi:hypothetical protein